MQVDYFYLARYIDYDIEFAAIDGHIVGGISQAASVDAAEVVGIQLIVLEGIQSERTVVQVEEPFAENVEFSVVPVSTGIPSPPPEGVSVSSKSSHEAKRSRKRRKKKDTPPIPLRKREEELLLPLLNGFIFILLFLLIITDSMSEVSLVSYFHCHSH